MHRLRPHSWRDRGRGRASGARGAALRSGCHGKRAPGQWLQGWGKESAPRAGITSTALMRRRGCAQAAPPARQSCRARARWARTGARRRGRRPARRTACATCCSPSTWSASTGAGPGCAAPRLRLGCHVDLRTAAACALALNVRLGQVACPPGCRGRHLQTNLHPAGSALQSQPACAPPAAAAGHADAERRAAGWRRAVGTPYPNHDLTLI